MSAPITSLRRGSRGSYLRWCGGAYCTRAAAIRSVVGAATPQQELFSAAAMLIASVYATASPPKTGCRSRQRARQTPEPQEGSNDGNRRHRKWASSAPSSSPVARRSSALRDFLFVAVLVSAVLGFLWPRPPGMCRTASAGNAGISSAAFTLGFSTLFIAPCSTPRCQRYSHCASRQRIARSRAVSTN